MRAQQSILESLGAMALAVALGCETPKLDAEPSEYEKRQLALEAESRAMSEELARRGREERRAREEAEQHLLDVEGEAACRQLASESRACRNGERCEQASPMRMKACALYMRGKGLDANPFK